MGGCRPPQPKRSVIIDFLLRELLKNSPFQVLQCSNEPLLYYLHTSTAYVVATLTPKQTACTPALSPPPQIHVRTRTASVGVFQWLCVHLSILSMTSSITAAACASPPAVPWTQLLPASWCGYGSTYIPCIHSQAILDSRRDCQVNMKQSSDIVKVLVTSNC